MRIPLITGGGVLAAALLLAPGPATAQQSGSPSGPPFMGMQQQMGTAGQQASGEGAPLYVSPGEVRQIQRRLARIGLEPGPIDGHWRPQTQQALAQFQQRAGLPPTGNIDITTYNRLRTVRGGSGRFLGLGEQGAGAGMQQGMGMGRNLPMDQPGMGMQGMQGTQGMPGMPMPQRGMGPMGMGQSGMDQRQGPQR